MNTISQFMALPLEVRNTFHNVASKSEFHNGYEFFAHEIPAAIADNVDAIRVILDGGSATTYVTMGDRGRAGGEYIEGVTVEFPDRDFSRHTSGANGGEYTPDNVTLESASVNRSRGADNMTADEVDTAQAALESDASILADADVITPIDVEIISETSGTLGEIDVVSQSGPFINEIPEAGGSLLGEVGEAVMDGFLPAAAAVAVGTHVANQFESEADRVSWGSMAAGGTVLALMTPPGQLALAGYAAWNIGKLAVRAGKWLAE